MLQLSLGPRASSPQQFREELKGIRQPNLPKQRTPLGPRASCPQQFRQELKETKQPKSIATQAHPLAVTRR